MNSKCMLAGAALLVTSLGVEARSSDASSLPASSRTLTLPRVAASFGRLQHASLTLQPGEVVLTFDDGPDPASTPAVLAALAQAHVRATFFMNGGPLLRAP